MSSVLSGKRILLTRTEEQSRETAVALRALGAIPLEMPLIALHPPPDPQRVIQAAHETAHYDLVIFTSKNAVERFYTVFSEEQRDEGVLQGVRFAAIGTGTAASMKKYGLNASIQPSAFVGEALAKAILEDAVFSALLSGKPRVLILRALEARDVLPEALQRAGCRVDIVPVYETRRASMEGRDQLIDWLEHGGIDVVLLASSSAVRSLAALLGERAQALLCRTVLASIGPVTTKTAQDLGLQVSVTAHINTVEALLEALENHYSR